MENPTLQTRTSLSRIPLGAFAVLLFLCAWTAKSRADFSGSDTFVTGSNWTLLSRTGTDGQILFQNNRAEFVVSSGTLSTNTVETLWNANTGSYTKDWSVQVDVDLARIPLKAYPDSGTLNLMVMSGTATTSNAFRARIGRYESPTNSYTTIISGGDTRYVEHGFKKNLTHTSLKISFDSTKKILTAYYGSEDNWKALDTASLAKDLTGWNMGNSDVFYAAIAGSTTGTNAILSGSAYFTNFVTITGSAVNVSYTNDFSSLVLPLWDLSGSTYAGEITPGIQLGLSGTSVPYGPYVYGRLGPLLLNEDVSGRLSTANYSSTTSFDFYYGITGTPSPYFQMDDGAGTVLTGGANVYGTISNSGTLTRVAMTVMASGTGTIALSATTHGVTFTETVKFNGEIQVDGTTSRKLVVTGGTADTKIKDLVTGKNVSYPSKKFGTGGSFDLPPEVTGDWTLISNLTPTGTKYAGTALVQTSPGGTANFIASGNYSPPPASSKISLNDNGLKLNLVITTSGSTMTVHNLTGKIYGQTLNYPAP